MNLVQSVDLVSVSGSSSLIRRQDQTAISIPTCESICLEDSYCKASCTLTKNFILENQSKVTACSSKCQGDDELNCSNNCIMSLVGIENKDQLDFQKLTQAQVDCNEKKIGKQCVQNYFDVDEETFQSFETCKSACSKSNSLNTFYSCSSQCLSPLLKGSKKAVNGTQEKIELSSTSSSSLNKLSQVALTVLIVSTLLC